jgi:isopentenyl-diphosphate delta-isomerase
LDHVFIGISDNDPVINTSEVEDWKKMTYYNLHKDILANPDNYTYWFKQIYQNVNSHLLNGKNNDL